MVTAPTMPSNFNWKLNVLSQDRYRRGSKTNNITALLYSEELVESGKASETS